MTKPILIGLCTQPELSSTDEGPLWRVDLQDLVAEWVPKRRDHLREVERKNAQR